MECDLFLWKELCREEAASVRVSGRSFGRLRRGVSGEKWEEAAAPLFMQRLSDLQGGLVLSCAGQIVVGAGRAEEVFSLVDRLCCSPP